jgi:hypothetical protein
MEDVLRNALANGIWKKALKGAISVAGGVILGNFVDPNAAGFWSLPQWIHIAKVTAAVVLIFEVKYWKDWADTPDSVPQQIQNQANKDINNYNKDNKQ